MAEHVCPWWLGYVLASPVRKLVQHPDKILNGYIKLGMTAVDIGCGMGYFSIPMAKIVGRQGKVICIDLQEKMLGGLLRRAKKFGVAEIIETKICYGNTLNSSDINGSADFVLAFAMVHEVPDRNRLFGEIREMLKPGGSLLIAEPQGHVTKEDFESTLDIAFSKGFSTEKLPIISKSHAALLRRTT